MNVIPTGTQAKLRVLATTDLHMHLTGHDYYGDRADMATGLIRTAGLIHAARNEADRDNMLCLLFDNGDSTQGTPLGDWAVQNEDQPHPLMQAFEHLQYDAMGLGNHDFNFGLDLLLKAVAKAPCPVLCSNLRGIGGQALPGIAASVVLDRVVSTAGKTHPVRIGVLSFVPPQTVRWDAHLLHGRIEVDDILTSARKGVTGLKRQGCDIVVALAHSGIDDRAAYAGMENAVVPLAALPGIDAVIGGHTHLHLPGADHAGMTHVNARTGEVHGTPVVIPGSAGSHLGVIDLTIKSDEHGHWEVVGFDCALRPISVRDANGVLSPATGEDRTLSDLLAPAHVATRSRMHHPVGHIDKPLHSYFSFIAPDHAMAVVAAAQAAALRPMLAGTAAEKLPLLSATAPCKYGGRSGPGSYTDVPAGKVSLRHIADLHVFPNELRAVIVTAQQVRDWLEMSATIFRQITPGSVDAPLIDPAIPGHDFDVLHGLTWQIDLSAMTRRIYDIRLGGRPISADQRFVVATNNYRASGGGNFTAVETAEPVLIPSLTIRDILCDYISGRRACDPLDVALPVWRFKPMPETRVSTRTGPGAVAHMGELAARNVEVSNPHADGFLRLSLPL